MPMSGVMEQPGGGQDCPSCLRLCAAYPPCLFFLFRQEDYSKESSKASSDGIIEQQQRD